MTTPLAVDLEITDDELAEWEKPFIARVAGTVIALKNVNAFSLDDYFALAEQADEDPRPVLSTICADPESETRLRRVGQKALTKILKVWFASAGVTPGESDGSES